MHTQSSVDFPTMLSFLPSACIHLTYPVNAHLHCLGAQLVIMRGTMLTWHSLCNSINSEGDLLFFLATNQQDWVIETCTSGRRLCLSMLLQWICICVHVCFCWFYPENEVGLHVKANATMMATSVCHAVPGVLIQRTLILCLTQTEQKSEDKDRAKYKYQSWAASRLYVCLPEMMLWILRCRKIKYIVWNIFEYLYSSKPRHKCFDIKHFPS